MTKELGGFLGHFDDHEILFHFSGVIFWLFIVLFVFAAVFFFFFFGGGGGGLDSVITYFFI